VRLLYLAHAYPRWAGDVSGAFIERLALAIRERGHDVSVLAPADEGKGGRGELHGLSVERLRYGPAAWENLAYRGTMADALRSPRGAMAFVTLVARQTAVARRIASSRPRFDLIHAHWWVPGGVTAWAAESIGGLPYIVTMHGTDVAILRTGRAPRVLAGRVLRGARVVTAVSSYLASTAAKATRLDPSAIVVRPMPVDVSRFTRESRGGGGVVTVGRLTVQKKIDLIIDAIADLKSRGRVLPLTIIGDGPERAGLERRAQERGIAAETRFVGAVAPEDVPRALGDADVFAFPAVDEGLGLAAAEALMLGIPVVASRSGGVPDIVPDGGAGRLVPPGHLAAFTRALEDVLASPASRDQAVAAGRLLRMQLSPAATAEAFEQIYARAVERG
jgi:glycosyltransferase involved in cell wall biosynthesis